MRRAEEEEEGGMGSWSGGGCRPSVRCCFLAGDQEEDGEKEALTHMHTRACFASLAFAFVRLDRGRLGGTVTWERRRRGALLAWEPDCSVASLFRFAPYPWLFDLRTGIFRTADKKGERKDYKGRGEEGACKQVVVMLKNV